jgi:hypothetical protein
MPISEINMSEVAHTTQIRLARRTPSYWRVTFAIERPAAQTRINKLLERGFHKPGDVENRLGYQLGQLGS